MSQLKDNLIEAEAMVRSRAWREGYSSFRRGDRADFLERGTKALAYEYGRLTAAYLLGANEKVPWISTNRPLPDRLVPYFVQALTDCVALSRDIFFGKSLNAGSDADADVQPPNSGSHPAGTRAPVDAI